MVLFATILISKVPRSCSSCLPLWWLVLVVATIMIVPLPSFPTRLSRAASILASVLLYFALYYSIVKWLSLLVLMLVEEFFIGLKLLKNSNRSLGAFLFFGLYCFEDLSSIYLLDGIVWLSRVKVDFFELLVYEFLILDWWYFEI